MLMVMNQWVRAHASAATGNCVEVGFHKAEDCRSSDCVEVRTCTCDEVLVRDSKDPSGPVLSYTRDEWLAFLDGAKNGEFDL